MRQTDVEISIKKNSDLNVFKSTLHWYALIGSSLGTINKERETLRTIINNLEE